MDNLSLSFSLNLVTTCLIASIVVYLVYFVRMVRSFPKGPLPLPIIGNVLHFGGKFEDPSPILKMTEWAKKYGPMYTLWIGHKPVIIVNNYELNNEASIMKRNDFIERSDAFIHELLRCGNENIVSSNGPHWEALRKVAVFAIRRFINSEILSDMTTEMTDEAIDLMVKEEKPFDPNIYMYFIVYNIQSMIAFGQNIAKIEDQYLRDATQFGEEFYRKWGNGFVSDFIPWLKPFYRKSENNLRNALVDSMEHTRKMFNERKKTHEQGNCRHFTDCVLEAKEEAIRENFSRSKYLNDDNLFMVVSDLFGAGTETTQITMRWALLFLANYPEIQEEIHREIIDNISDRKPNQEDRELLPITYSFLLEILRLQVPAPTTMDHCAGLDTELSGYKLPKGTMIIVNIFAQNTDPKYWSEPLEFKPKRFIDSNGKLITGRIPSSVTFGLGRRACPGEKLALNNLFMIITRLIQKVKIELPTGAGTADFVPLNALLANLPKNYKIICNLR